MFAFSRFGASADLMHAVMPVIKQQQQQRSEIIYRRVKIACYTSCNSALMVTTQR